MQLEVQEIDYLHSAKATPLLSTHGNKKYLLIKDDRDNPQKVLKIPLHKQLLEGLMELFIHHEI